MGLFDKLESRLEHGVNGAFARAFKSEVQPVELAAGMRRAMDDRAASIGKGKRPIVPNLYTFELSPTDYERLVAWGSELDDELIAAAQEHADEQRYIPGGPFTIVLDEADDLETGVFRLRPTTAKAAEARAFAQEHPRHVPTPAPRSADVYSDDEQNDYSTYEHEAPARAYDNESYEHDDYDNLDDRSSVNSKPHGASRLDDIRTDADTDTRNDDHDSHDDHGHYNEYAHDDYAYDDEGDEYGAYDFHEDDERTATPVDPYAKADHAANNGSMGARIKNYLFGNYAPEPHQEHAGTDHRSNDVDDVRDDYYPEHDADERAQADHTSYDDHYETYDEQDDVQNHRESGRERFEASDSYENSYEDDPYEYEHTRPAPQKSASRPVRALPKKRDTSSNDRSFASAHNEPASAEQSEQYEDYPVEANDHEQHEGYISYDPEAEHAQRGGYTTYGEADDSVSYEEEPVARETPVRETHSRSIRDSRDENRRPKRDQSRSYSHAWDDDDDYGDPTGYEPAPSTPAPPARRATSPRERPWLKIEGQRYPLMGAITVIGRDDDADIILDDPGVSRRHSEVRITHDGPHLVMSIRDLGSTNGTYINGDRVEAEHLHDGDRLTVGRTSMTIHLGDQP